MKKQGFTLTEVLITLGIIGIVAALSAPALDGLLPDKRKTAVLKANKLISEITQEILTDESLFMVEYNNIGYPCVGLGCQNKPIDPAFNKEGFSGKTKYGNILSEKMELSSAVSKSGNSICFTTKDGLYWEVTTNAPQNDDRAELVYSTATIEIDIDGKDKGKNSVFSASVNKPDKFKFHVDTFGRVIAGDALTQAYLENPLNTNDKKIDRARAKVLLLLPEYNTNQ